MTDPVTNEEDLEVQDEALDPAAAAAEGMTSEAATDGATEALDDTTDADVSVDAAVDGQAVNTTGREPAPASGDADSEVAQVRDEFERLNDRHLRLVAEFNNFRRRSEQERLSAWTRAQADLVGKFVDVLDDLQRVAELDLGNATVEAIMEGIDLVERKFVRLVGEADVDMLDPAGHPFDPEIMEAMMRVPAESDEQVDTVAQVFQKGYSLKGILVRPARVSVYTQG